MATIHSTLTRQAEESVAAFKHRCAEALVQTKAPNDFAVGRFAEGKGVLVGSTEWGGFYDTLPSPICVIASYKAHEATNKYFWFDQFELDAAPVNLFVALNTDMVFADALEPMGMFWRSLCNAEDSLAFKLLEYPAGACVATNDRVWFLRLQDGKRVLCNAPWSEYDVNLDGDDIRSRHDSGLEWVDINEHGLEEEISAVNALHNDFQAYLCLEDSSLCLEVKRIFDSDANPIPKDSKDRP